MQAMKEDPPADFKCKDKFLVQSIAITAERQHLLPTELWPTVEREAKDQIRENKIRCAFLPPLDHAAVDQTKEERRHVAQSTVSQSPPTQQFAPEPSTVHAPASPVISASSAADLSASVSRTSHNSTLDAHNLKRELETAHETIKSLQASFDRLQRETSTLRQRKPESSSPSTAPTMTAVHLNQPQGLYPVSYIAGAALISFIFAYLFF